jgi:hypothetical protein
MREKSGVCWRMRDGKKRKRKKLVLRVPFVLLNLFRERLKCFPSFSWAVYEYVKRNSVVSSSFSTFVDDFDY